MHSDQDPAPAPFISEAKDSAQFYSNRVIKEYKESDPANVEWVRSFIALLDALTAYVKAIHTTGLVWNPNGEEVTAYTPREQSVSAAAPSGSVPPPPPAPPAPPAPPVDTGAGGGMGAVFSQINQGSDVTRSLRKVDASEMTHKNPSLRDVPAPAIHAPTKPAPAAKPAAIRAKKPASKMLDGNKWIVENFENDSAIVIDNTEINQTVNVFGCTNSVIQVKGKVNAVSLGESALTGFVQQDQHPT